MPTRIERLRAVAARVADLRAGRIAALEPGDGDAVADALPAVVAVVDATQSYFDEPCSIGAKRVIEALAALEEEA